MIQIGNIGLKAVDLLPPYKTMDEEIRMAGKQ